MASDPPASPDAGAPAVRGGPQGLVHPTFPQRSGGLPGAAALAEISAAAERAGAGGLWACDHLFWHGPLLEVFAALAVAATATTRATIGTCVLQLPLRAPAAVAKQAASLQHLSGGRFVLGVGAGSRRGEFEAAGVDFATRGGALDAGIDRLRGAWGALGPGNDEGGARENATYRQLPVPTPVPLWVGGSNEAALRRAARAGDGWVPLFLDPEEYRSALGRLDKEAERAGRDPAELSRAIVAFVSVGGNDAAERGLEWMSSLYGIPARAFANRLVAGSPRTCARTLERYLEAGAQHVVVRITADDPLVPFGILAQEFAGCPDARPPARSATDDV